MVIVDNNILSSLAKIDRLDLLKKFFDNVVTAPEVLQEFRDERVRGYEFPEKVEGIRTFKERTDSNWLVVTSLREQEMELKEEFLNKGLSEADAECLALSKGRSDSLLTDDKKLGEIAGQRGVEVFDLESFLEACVRRELIENSEEIREIINMLEEEDYYVFSEGFKDDIHSLLRK